MQILVIYNDKSIDMVHDYRLDFLIKSGKVSYFRRSNGQWVNVFSDKIRGKGGEYDGPDRRKKHKVKHVL